MTCGSTRNVKTAFMSWNLLSLTFYRLTVWLLKFVVTPSDQRYLPSLKFVCLPVSYHMYSADVQYTDHYKVVSKLGIHVVQPAICLLILVFYMAFLLGLRSDTKQTETNGEKDWGPPDLQMKRDAQCRLLEGRPHNKQQTRNSATAEIACDAWNGHSRSLKVIRCCADSRGVYDFLLSLNSNLTSMFNRSWDTTPSLHIHTPPCLLYTSDAADE